MDTMQDALRKAGLITPKRQAQLALDKRSVSYAEIKQHHKKVMQQVEPTLDNLSVCHSVNEFRSLAIAILTDTPSAMRHVIILARQLREISGGKHLIWQLHQIKAELGDLDRGDREQYLKRSLRRAGGLGRGKK